MRRFWICWWRILWVEQMLAVGNIKIPGVEYLFQGPLYNVSHRCNFFGLPDSIDTLQFGWSAMKGVNESSDTYIEGLLLEHRVPLRLHQEYVVCDG